MHCKRFTATTPAVTVSAVACAWYCSAPNHANAVQTYGITSVAPAVSTTAVVDNYRGAAVALAVKLCYRDRALVPAVIYS